MIPIVTVKVNSIGGGTANGGVKTLAVDAFAGPRGAFLFKLRQQHPSWNCIGFGARYNWVVYLGGPYDHSARPPRDSYDPRFMRRLTNPQA